MILRLHAYVLLCAALVACGSSPEPAYYALGRVPGVLIADPLGSIEVRRPSIAGYLDRSEILTQVVDHRLRLASNERWGEPLALMIGRVLADDLGERLPGSTVFTESSDMSIHASRVVELSISKLELDADGYVRLKALLALRSDTGQAPALTRTLTLQARPSSSETPALVDTMSGLVGLLANEIAGALKASAVSQQAELREPGTD